MARVATIERNTKETQISLTLNLDGSGKCDVSCPIGFFGHMLNSFCKHGLFDLSGTLKGDLEVDQLGNVFVNKAVQVAPVLAKAQRLQKGVNTLFDLVNDFFRRPLFFHCLPLFSG